MHIIYFLCCWVEPLCEECWRISCFSAATFYFFIWSLQSTISFDFVDNESQVIVTDHVTELSASDWLSDGDSRVQSNPAVNLLTDLQLTWANDTPEVPTVLLTAVRPHAVKPLLLKLCVSMKRACDSVCVRASTLKWPDCTR